MSACRIIIALIATIALTSTSSGQVLPAPELPPLREEHQQSPQEKVEFRRLNGLFMISERDLSYTLKRGLEAKVSFPLFTALSDEQLVSDLKISETVYEKISEVITRYRRGTLRGDELTSSMREIETALEKDLSKEQASTCRSRFEAASFYSLGPTSYAETISLSDDEIRTIKSRIPELEKRITSELITLEHDTYALIFEDEFGLDKETVERVEESLGYWKMVSPPMPSFFWCTLDASIHDNLPIPGWVYYCTMSGSGRACSFVWLKTATLDEVTRLLSLFGMHAWAKQSAIQDKFRKWSEKQLENRRRFITDRPRFQKEVSDLMSDVEVALTPEQWTDMQTLRFILLVKLTGFANAMKADYAKDVLSSEELETLSSLSTAIETAMCDKLNSGCGEIHSGLIEELFEGIENESLEYLRESEYGTGVPMIEAFLMR